MLKDLNIVASYRSDRNNLVTDFYLPCLGQATRYSRAVGFFTSSSLSAAAKGLYRFVCRRGYMRLIASPLLNRDDVNAIRQGYQQRDEVFTNALLRELDRPVDHVIKDRLGFLAWLIGEGLLDVKIAIVETGDDFGIYHEKIGIFSDEANNHVVFTGSANESIGGLISNFESIQVFRSWVSSDVGRIQPIMDDFEALWQNVTANLAIYDFPDAVRKKLLKFRPTQIASQDPEEPSSTSTTSAQSRTPTIPESITVRDYQKTAVEKWFANGGKGVWRMATGTGKTITALALTTHLARVVRDSSRSLVVIVVCPYKHLVSQWASEAQQFNITPLKCFESKQQWAEPLNDLISGTNELHLEFALAITTNATLQTAAFQEIMARTKASLLFIGDEMHNLGAENLNTCLPQNATYRLGLSATPERWFDDEGTAALFRYFGPVIYELTLAEAISLGALCRYDYFPHVVEFDEMELEGYLELTHEICQIMGSDTKELTDEIDNPRLKLFLLKRARLIASAKNKLPALEAAVDPTTAYNLFYCGDGRVQYEPANDEIRQIDAVIHLLGRKMGMSVHSYTADTYLEQRNDLRLRFASGQLQGLVAIRCLDEGVDIPETRRAFILASSTNPKQFIQRRGRILRRSPGKKIAAIHDFLVVPPSQVGTEEFYATERRLFRRELERVVLFAKLADNGPQALRTLLPLRERYQLLDVG